MNLILVQNPTKIPTPVILFNGLGCPQCSAALVDGYKGVNHKGLTQETHCLQCDYVSVYNINTFELARKY